MTQPLSQEVEVHLHAGSVLNFMPQLQQRADAAQENFKACKETILEAAQLYAEEKDDEKLTKLREKLLQLVEYEGKVKAHKAALMHVGQHYRPTLEKSDFAGLLQQHIQPATTTRPEQDEDVVEFDQIAGIAPAAEEELSDDPDIIITDRAVARNERCPYTMKLLVELENPVEDDKGFVYESSAIHSAITRGGGVIECPVAGASHMVRATNLKPSRRVLRLQKQKRWQGTQGGQGPPTQQDRRAARSISLCSRRHR